MTKIWYQVLGASFYRSKIESLYKLEKNKSRNETECLPENIILRLLNSYLNISKNVIADNYFSLISLANRL